MQLGMTTQAISDDDGVNLLIEMGDDTVRQKVGEAFVAQMEQSGRVQGTFFPSPAALSAPLPQELNDWVGQVASSLIALALAQCSGHGFGATVNSAQAQSFLNTNLTPSNASFTDLAMRNYQALFPAYCTANNTSFGAFLAGAYGSAASWGSLLADHLSSPAYINQEMIKLNPAVDPGAWYQALFANIYKVQCLNAAEVGRILDAWNPELQGKQQPGKVIPWTVYDHMVAGSYSLYIFMGQVQNAISTSRSTTQTLGCQGGAAAHCSTETTTVYGAAVNTWLSNNRGLGGFINGPSSENTDYTNDSGGGGSLCGCFLPGTPILMGDGSTKPVEDVRAGNAVVGRDGEVHTRSSQGVHWRIEPHELLFGINDYPPFFNASHPFMTTKGWKSMSPRASRRINPDLEVSKLKEGDVLLQAHGGTPLRYREVEITRITKMLASDASSPEIHSLHLTQENPGYHANGFLVAVNYPQLREEHFVGAFAGITEAERAYLRSHFEPLVPFLRRGLGNYVSEVLRRALGAPGESEPIGGPAQVVEHHPGERS